MTSWWRYRSIRVRLTLWYAAALSAVLGLYAGGVFTFLRHSLSADLDGGLRDDREVAEQMVENPGDELGQLAAVFNDAFARLERSFEQLRRFTADASHELRTPLTAMRSVGEVGLREHRDAAAYREIIGSMLEETDQLGRLVEGLLMLSRADGGNVSLKREGVDLAELARDVAAHLGVLAEEKGQSFAVEASGPVPAWVDRLVIRQALINLVDNAVKYTPPGGSVRISVRDGGPGPTVEVTDTGSGVPAEHRDRVFDRFYRIDKARTRDLGGAGLGLAIARWAVEAHGGRIDLDSVEGRGSTFRITLVHAEGSNSVPRATPVS